MSTSVLTGGVGWGGGGGGGGWGWGGVSVSRFLCYEAEVLKEQGNSNKQKKKEWKSLDVEFLRYRHYRLRGRITNTESLFGRETGGPRDRTNILIIEASGSARKM